MAVGTVSISGKATDEELVLTAIGDTPPSETVIGMNASPDMSRGMSEPLISQESANTSLGGSAPLSETTGETLSSCKCALTNKCHGGTACASALKIP